MIRIGRSDSFDRRNDLYGDPFIDSNDKVKEDIFFIALLPN